MQKTVLVLTLVLFSTLGTKNVFGQDSLWTSTVDFGQVDFEQFVNYEFCVTMSYIDLGSNTVIAPSNYNLEVEGLPSMIKCSIDSSGNAFFVCFSKRELLCNCFVPLGAVKGKMVAVPKTKTITPAHRDFYFKIVNNPDFVERCWSCFIAFLILLTLIVYLYGVITKPRFDSTAKFEVHEEDKLAVYAPNNQLPRKKLATGFVTRYLIPFIPESKMVDGMKIIAGTSKTTVLIAKESLSERMSKNGEPLNPKSKKDIKVFKNNTIEIEKSSVKHWVYTYMVH